MLRPYILTLTLNETLTRELNTLREQHFPPERNVLDAHVTLFHSLPAEYGERVRTDLGQICSGHPEFRVVLPEVKQWGRGVFMTLENPALLALRAILTKQWGAWLTAQDRQEYRPHVTIQNKEAKRLHETLSPTWQLLESKALGLHLWRYEGGPWSSVERFLFKEIAYTQDCEKSLGALGLGLDADEPDELINKSQQGHGTDISSLKP